MESLVFSSVMPQAESADLPQQPPDSVSVLFGLSPGQSPVGALGVLQQPEEQAFSGGKAPRGRKDLLQQPSGQPLVSVASFPEDKGCEVVKD